MPIYEYACEKCGKQIEVLHKVSERGPARCAACGAKLTRLVSRSSFQLKGGGWYSDLYASTPRRGAGAAEDRRPEAEDRTGSRKEKNGGTETATPKTDTKPAKPAPATAEKKSAK